MLKKIFDAVMSWLSYCPACGGPLEPGKTIPIPFREEGDGTDRQLIICKQCATDPEMISLKKLESVLQEQGVDEKEIKEMCGRFKQHKAGHGLALTL
jgi:RNase P subunit RPR2